MAESKPLIPFGLRMLQEQLNELNVDEVQISTQLGHLGREIRKQKKTLIELSQVQEKLTEAYNGLSKAKIASLPEYFQLRMMISGNQSVLNRTASTIKEYEHSGKELGEKLVDIRKLKLEVEADISGWNQILVFPKRHG